MTDQFTALLDTLTNGDPAEVADILSSDNSPHSIIELRAALINALRHIAAIEKLRTKESVGADATLKTWVQSLDRRELMRVECNSFRTSRERQAAHVELMARGIGERYT